jgi:hypothetical protein
MSDECDLARMERLTYSPDLAPCDLFLFGYLKRRLGRRTFPELPLLAVAKIIAI